MEVSCDGKSIPSQNSRQLAASMEMLAASGSAETSTWNTSGQHHQEEGPLGSNEYFSFQMQIVGTFFYALIFLSGVTGNLLVMIVVTINKELRNSTNIFLLNLSVADLLVLLFCLPTAVIELYSPLEVWVLGKVMCYLLSFLETFVANASVLTVIAISLERYYAIVHPLRATLQISRRRAVAAVLAIWACAAAFSGPVVLITEFNPTQEFTDASFRPTCDTHIDSLSEKLYHYGALLLFYVAPVVFSSLVYRKIVRRLLDEPRIGRKSKARGRRRVVRMLAVVIFLFFLFHLPFKLLIVCISVLDLLPVLPSQEFFLTCVFLARLMLQMNSAVNPLVYSAMSTKFRAGFRRVFLPSGSAASQHGGTPSGGGIRNASAVTTVTISNTSSTHTTAVSTSCVTGNSRSQ